MILLLTDVFLLLTQVLLWMVVGLVAWFVLLRALPRAFLSLLVLLLILAVLVISFVQGPPIDSGVLEILWRIISFPFTPLGLAIVLIAILLTNTKLNKFARRAMLIGLVILTLLSFPFVAYFLVQELELEAIEAVCPAPSLASGARRVIVLMGQGTTRSYLKPITARNTLAPREGQPLNAADISTLAQLPLLPSNATEVDAAGVDRSVPIAFFPASAPSLATDASGSSGIDQPNGAANSLLAQTPPPATTGTPTPGTNRSEALDQQAEQMKQRAEDAETRLKELNDRLQQRQSQIDEMKKRAEDLQQRAEEQRKREEERQQRLEERRQRRNQQQPNTTPAETGTPRTNASPSPAASQPKRRPRYAITQDGYRVLTAQPIQLTDKGNRLIYAANLYQRESGSNPLILVSASTKLDRRQKEGEKREEISESADIQRFLTTTMDVPASATLLDHNSRSVRRSAENVKKLLGDQNINYGNQLTLVTTAMNMHRTALTFEQVFDDTGTEIVVRPTDFHTIPPVESIGDLATGTDLVEHQVQASDFLPNSYALYLSSQAIDEYISSFYYFLRGWMASPLTLTRCPTVTPPSPPNPPPLPPNNGGTTSIVPNFPPPPPQDSNPSQPPTNGKW